MERVQEVAQPSKKHGQQEAAVSPRHQYSDWLTLTWLKERERFDGSRERGGGGGRKEERGGDEGSLQGKQRSAVDAAACGEGYWGFMAFQLESNGEANGDGADVGQVVSLLMLRRGGGEGGGGAAGEGGGASVLLWREPHNSTFYCDIGVGIGSEVRGVDKHVTFLSVLQNTID